MEEVTMINETPETKITAQDAFLGKYAKLDQMLQKLMEQHSNHYDVDPDTLNWGDVGVLDSHIALIQRVLNREG